MKKITFVRIETIGKSEFKDRMFYFIAEKHEERYDEKNGVRTITYNTVSGMEIILTYFDDSKKAIMIDKVLWNKNTKAFDFYESLIYRDSENDGRSVKHFFIEENI